MDWIIVVALTIGHDSKAMKNMRPPRAKVTTFDGNVNQMISAVFLLKLVVILSLSGVATVYEHANHFPALKTTADSRGSCFLVAFFQYCVLYSSFIPISLMVTAEIIRLFHMFIITWAVFPSIVSSVVPSRAIRT
jgi:phospholipid-transporting ATPase